jgi:hypothetical protein
MGQQFHGGNHDVPARWCGTFHRQRGIPERSGSAPRENDKRRNACRREDQESWRRDRSTGERGNGDSRTPDGRAGNADQQITNQQPAPHQPEIAQDITPGLRLHAARSPLQRDRQAAGV